MDMMVIMYSIKTLFNSFSVYRLENSMKKLYWLSQQSYCCFFIIKAWIVIPVNKYEILFYIIIWCLVLVIHITSSVLYLIDNIDIGTDRIFILLNRWYKVIVSRNTVEYHKCLFLMIFKTFIFSSIVSIKYSICLYYIY